AKYPTSKKVYQSKRYTEGELFKNPDLARTLRKLVEAEKQNTSKGRHAALKAARDRFYKGDIAQTMAKFSEENGGLFRYEDFVKIPFEGLLSKQYAAERRKLIDPNHASLELRPGNPEKFMKGSQAALFQDPIINLDGNGSHDGDTSYIAIIDSNRNMIGFMP